jgi:hypothetical protein
MTLISGFGSCRDQFAEEALYSPLDRVDDRPHRIDGESMQGMAAPSRHTVCRVEGAAVATAQVLWWRGGGRREFADGTGVSAFYRAGELVAIRVPTVAEEAVRDLCRARADMVVEETRARHRLGKFLLRHNRMWRGGDN